MKLHPRVTRSLVESVKRFEGLRRNSARLADGGWTIGYGHTRSARSGVVISPEDAEALLYYDLSQVAEKVEAWTFTPLNQNQFEALTAFAFNIGMSGFRTSSALRQVNEGQILQAAEALELWRKAEFDGEAQIVDALVRRRAAEKAHFLTPPEGFRPSPSPVLRPMFDAPLSSVTNPPRSPAAPIASMDRDRKGAVLAEKAGPAESGSAWEIAPTPGQPDAEGPPQALAFPSFDGAAVTASILQSVEDKPFGHGVEIAAGAPGTAPLEAGVGRVAVSEPPTLLAPTSLEAPALDTTGNSPFEPPPPPVEAPHTNEAPFMEASAMAMMNTSIDEALSPVSGLKVAATVDGDGPPQARRQSGLWRGDHTLLFGALGCAGVAFLAAALFSILFSRANPLNLVVGLIGIVLLTPAGAFFSIRFLNARDAMPER